MKFGKRTFRKLMMRAMVVACAFAIAPHIAFASGEAPDPLCVMADDFGQYAKRDVRVNAALAEGVPGGWTDTQIDLLANKVLRIVSSGNLELCGGVEVIEKTLAPGTSGWVSSNVVIPPGRDYSIEVSDSFKRWPATTTDCGANSGRSSQYWDADCYSRGGRSLFAYIGTSPVPWTTPLMNPAQRLPYDLDYATTDPKFYELYDYVNKTAGYHFNSFNSPAEPSGELWFRYGGGTTTNGYDNSGVTGHTGNGYKIKITIFPPCPGKRGEYLVGFVGAIPPYSANPVTNKLIDSSNGEVDSINGGVNDLINLHACANIAGPPPPPPLPPLPPLPPECMSPAGTYSGTTPHAGRLWLRVIDSPTIDWNGDGIPRGDNDYAPYIVAPDGTASGSNSGFYTVKITTEKLPPSGFSNVLNELIEPVRTFLLGAYDPMLGKHEGGLTKRMYEGITGNVNFIQLVRLLLVLSVILMGMAYGFGFSSVSQTEFVMYVVKFAVVLMVISPGSWEFFYDYLFTFFIEGVDSLIQALSGQLANALDGGPTTVGPDEITQTFGTPGPDFDQAGDSFGFLNQTLAQFFTVETNIKIQGLLAGMPIGMIMALMIYFSMGLFLFAILKSVLLYLISIIMISLMLFMAPIFIPMLLFSLTRDIFHRWLKQLMDFGLQPVLLLTVLAIFNVFIFSVFQSMLSFTVCYTCLWTVDLPVSEYIFFNAFGNFDKFCLMHGYVPWGMGSEQDPEAALSKTPVGLFVVLVFLIMVNAMLKFTDWVVSVATAFTSVTGVSLKTPVAEALTQTTAAIKEVGNTAQDVGKLGVGVVKRAGSVAGRAGDAAGFVLTRGKESHALTDRAKKAARSVLPRGRTAHMVLGGRSARGSGNDKFARSLMTSNEKRTSDERTELLGNMTKTEKQDFLLYEQDRKAAHNKLSGQDRRDDSKMEQKKKEELGQFKMIGGHGSRQRKMLAESKGYSSKTPEERAKYVQEQRRKDTERLLGPEKAKRKDLGVIKDDNNT